MWSKNTTSKKTKDHKRSTTETTDGREGFRLGDFSRLVPLTYFVFHLILFEIVCKVQLLDSIQENEDMKGEDTRPTKSRPKL